MTRRVVVTGIGLATPIGHDLAAVTESLRAGRHGIRAKPEWDAISHLNAKVAAECVDLELAKRWPRQRTRSMGRVGLLATYATEQALEDAGISLDVLTGGRMGVAYGSTQGSSSALEEVSGTLFGARSLKGIVSSAYLKYMAHTCAANLALFFSLRGRVISTCAACVSSSQAIGSAAELIRYGAQDVMIAGGAEEMHYSHVGQFDLMYAASTKFNASPEMTPRPFDAGRDGLVVGEGAGTLVLEEYEHARRRGAHIHAEILGYATNCDGLHMTTPSFEGMATVMRLALEDARVAPDRISYINAHATATDVGDIAESRAAHAVFGERQRISSTKSLTGHTLGACGAIEAAFCVSMLNEGYLVPTRNLEVVDERCAPLDYLVGDARDAAIDLVMTNNFAFGGINTSLVLGRPHPSR